MINSAKHISAVRAIICLLLLSSASYSQNQQKLVIKNVNLITMDSLNKVVQNAVIVIAENKIESINGVIPKNAKLIDGKNKWLIPGLIDMHVHLLADLYIGNKQQTALIPDLTFNVQDMMTPFIANGVTTIFELNSSMENYSQKKDIERGYVIGPRIAMAALIDGGDGNGRNVNTPQDGRQAVRCAKADGYDFIKVYSNLNDSTFFAIVDEANKQGMKTIGHIPGFTGRLKEAFVKGFDMVAHAEELAKHAVNYSVQEAQDMAQMLKENDTWLSPTLTTMERILSQIKSLDELKALPTLKYMHPLLQSKWLTANKYNKMHSAQNIARYEKYVKFNMLLVNACKQAGVPIVAGTDALTSSVVYGFSLHDELELLVKAGLTPQEAVKSATVLAARWLGIDTQVGTIEEGKLADLVLLDENPLLEIKSTRKIAGVFVNGKWLDKVKINTLLSDLANWNTANKNKFDWQTKRTKKK
jgi:imidazolonepropionase-like amidohydrolase